MDGPRDYHTKLVKHMKSLTYGSLEKKNDSSEVVYRTEIDSQT